MANLVVLVGVSVFVIKNPSSNQTLTQTVSADGSNSSVASPLDQLSTADIAVNAASLAGLPEAVSTANLADSVKTDLAITSAATQVVAKPQVIDTTTKSRNDIFQYTSVVGDSISKLAARFDVSSDSIRWSNGLTGNDLAPHTKLWISPISNGFLYVVKSGDTAASLAAKFSSNRDKIIGINDADISGLRVGERIIIPGGSIAAPTATFSNYGGFAWGGGTAVYGSNGYDFGWCTWYVASRINVPSNWGNAVDWAFFARQTPGWSVDGVPVPGMIAQRSGGWGHVGIVEAVSPDGKMIKYSDMNGLAGWAHVGKSGWVPVSVFDNYIHR